MMVTLTVVVTLMTLVMLMVATPKMVAHLATSTGKEMPLRLPPPTRILLTPPQVRPRERRVKKYLRKRMKEMARRENYLQFEKGKERDGQEGELPPVPVTLSCLSREGGEGLVVVGLGAGGPLPRGRYKLGKLSFSHTCSSRHRT